jgi:tetratricopeptide (TPR) repeat protein
MALVELDRGNVAEAHRMAERLAASKDITTEEWGGPDFILGTLAAKAAEEATLSHRIESFRLASLYLTQSRERGFPAHRESAGLYLLGKSLCRCGRLEEALPVLEQALPLNPDRANEIRMLLIEARMGVQPPELDKALAECQELLSEPRLADVDRRQALIEQAQILLRMNRTRECAAVLDKIPDNLLLRYEISLLRGRLALCEGQRLKRAATTSSGESTDNRKPSSSAAPGKTEESHEAEAKEKFRQALEAFRKALTQDLGDNRAAQQAPYLIGICLMEQGDLAAALNQMERAVRAFPETPEGLAALFQEGELARRMGRHAEALSAYRRLLAAIAKQDTFHNPWLELTQLKSTLLSVYDDYLKAEKYETAVVLSKSLVHLLPKDEALLLTARVYHAWAQNLLEQAEHLPIAQADELRKQARTQFRRAGDTLTAVAREQFTTRQYPDQVWNSASEYFAGHDFRHAAEMLRLYMKNEASLRHAQALVDLGECELSLGNTQRALQSFHECIQQHPRDVAIYRARLLASRAAVAVGDMKQAETLLQDNLNGELLAPASKEWRDSLFALAELFHTVARDRDAIPRLQEALQRYPNAPQATVARYLLADSSRRLAMDLRASLAKEISSTVRGQRSNESNRLLHQALDTYVSLQDSLSRRDTETLNPQEMAILRNCRFAAGDTYFALERYPEALRTYQSAANHYATAPEALDAYLQIANVYRRMDRPAEARTSLEQARLALRRIPPGARFEQTTNYNRRQWGELLDRLCSL